MEMTLTGYSSLYCLNEHNKHETAMRMTTDLKKKTWLSKKKKKKLIVLRYCNKKMKNTTKHCVRVPTLKKVQKYIMSESGNCTRKCF